MKEVDQISLLTALMWLEGRGGNTTFCFKGCICFINPQNLVKSLIQLSWCCGCPETECIRGTLYTISATSNLLLFCYSKLAGSHGVSETKSDQRKMNINNPLSLRRASKRMEISCLGSTQRYEMATEVLTLVLMIASSVIYCSAWAQAFSTSVPRSSKITVEIMNL